jgi:hypothetical protein
MALTVFAVGVWIGRHWFPPVASLWAVVDYCNVSPIEVVCYSEPRWRVLWHTHYSPWQYRVPLLALALYFLWRVAGWLDRRKSKAG